MPGKLTLYPSSAPSRSFVLSEGREYVAGRDPESDVPLEDPRVSVRHARLSGAERGWRIRDLDSKNGTFVNGVRGKELDLSDEDWLSFGGLLARFERVSDEHVANLSALRTERLRTSAELSREMLGLDPRALLRRLIESAIALAGAERGFVLIVGGQGRLQTEVSFGGAPFPSGMDRFAGSVGAVERALATGKPVVAADAKSDAFLAKRRSVIELGIGALACVPLSAPNGVLGVLYVDGRREGGTFTDLDLEILEALAEHASLVLAGAEVGRRIRKLADDTPQDAVSPSDWREALAKELAATPLPPSGAASPDA